MIEVWQGQVRVFLRAPARFRRLVPPLGSSSPVPREPRYRNQDARVPVPCRRRGAQRVGLDALISPRIDKRGLRRQHPPADSQRTATVWTRERRRWGVLSGGWLK